MTAVLTPDDATRHIAALVRDIDPATTAEALLRTTMREVQAVLRQVDKPARKRAMGDSVAKALGGR